jgi:hypothetical protein
MNETYNRYTENDLAPESIRDWAVKLLRQIGNSRIDISRLNDTEYLQKMSSYQLSRIKKVAYGKEGQIVAVDLHDIVNTIEVAATIAGTREIAKEQAKMRKEESEEKNRKARSDKLTLDISGKYKKPEKAEKAETATTAAQSAESKHAVNDGGIASLLSNISGSK